MPAEQFVVTADICGNEIPSGGMLYTILPEAEAFAEELKARPGVRSVKIERATMHAFETISQWYPPGQPQLEPEAPSAAILA